VVLFSHGGHIEKIFEQTTALSLRSAPAHDGDRAYAAIDFGNGE
jgi:hypothetical protein